MRSGPIFSTFLTLPFTLKVRPTLKSDVAVGRNLINISSNLQLPLLVMIKLGQSTHSVFRVFNYYLNISSNLQLLLVMIKLRQSTHSVFRVFNYYSNISSNLQLPHLVTLWSSSYKSRMFSTHSKSFQLLLKMTM